MVQDYVATIASEVHAMSEEMDLVITAGGVGPTPDDVTMAGTLVTPFRSSRLRFPNVIFGITGL